MPTVERSADAVDVAFIIDRVMHYHVDMLRAVEQGLWDNNLRFAVLSATEKNGTVGRAAISERVVAAHGHYSLTEKTLQSFTLRYQHGLVALAQLLRPRVVMSTCHSGTLSEWQLLGWARRHGCRTVAWQCGYEYNPGRLKDFVLRHFVPKFDFHLCYHSNAKAYALRYGANEDQTLVMHNTIDEARIVPMERRAARQQLIGRHPEIADRRIVLYVGAILEEKRLDQVMDALQVLQRDDLVFVVVGDGPHLPVLLQRYKGRRDWLSIGRVVEGVGVYFDAADVFVLPGTGGLAINEALAHRTPVIAGYADGSADDLVLDGQTGYRLRQGTARELADALARTLADPERAAAMGLAGEALVRGPLSFRSFTRHVVDALTAQCRLAGGTT